MLPKACMFIIFIYAAHLYYSQQYFLLFQAIYTLFLFIKLNRNSQPISYNPKSLPSKNHCSVCDTSKPPRYYHCRRCQICIYRMDHHCEWFGCCVGQYNGKLYFQALFNIFILGILYVLHRTIIWSWNFWYLILLMLAIFAIYESGRLLKEFILSIEKNQTLIEGYKLVRGRKKPRIKKWEQVMGKKGINWVLPTFAGLSTCNVVEQTYKQTSDAVVKEYTYADEYLYGADSDEESQQEQNANHTHHHNHNHSHNSFDVCTF